MKRTGIKIAYRKIKSFTRYPYKYVSTPSIKFPEKGQGYLQNMLWLHTLINEVRDKHLEKTIGFLHNRPNSFALKVWQKIIYFNPNNLGVWSNKNINNLLGTEKSENELIAKMTNILGSDKNNWSGYTTTGATEANIFSAWIGRNYLKSKMSSGKICIVVNSLTHYSIKKAASIIDIPVFEIGIDRKKWTINPNILRNKIVELNKKGYKGFLIPITLGYTQTGTNDDYVTITKIIARLQKETDVLTFIWVDAAINGLVLPFTRNKFLPLRTSLIKTFILDFHKTGMCPIPSGLVLYRSSLVKYISQKVAYIDEGDNTLLGSRSGASPAAMLSVINSLGKNGLRKIIYKSIENKDDFISSLKAMKLNIEVINSKDGISGALVSNKKLPEKFVNKYGLFAKKWTYFFENCSENLYIYKFNFL